MKRVIALLTVAFALGAMAQPVAAFSLPSWLHVFFSMVHPDPWIANN
jgi:hypothetical protein